MTVNGLSRLIEMARAIKLNESQHDEQRRSFVDGNPAIENAAITRSMVDDVARTLKAE